MIGVNYTHHPLNTLCLLLEKKRKKDDVYSTVMEKDISTPCIVGPQPANDNGGYDGG